MRSIFSILGDKYRRSPIAKGVIAARVIEVAQKVILNEFGAEITRHARADYYKDNLLAFSCQSSVAAQNLKLAEKVIVAKINEIMGENVVKRVKYTL